MKTAGDISQLRKNPNFNPSDLKGLKIRSQESQIHIEMWKAFGASPVPISIPEVMSALQTGLVDGFDNSTLFTSATGWYPRHRPFCSIGSHVSARGYYL